MTALPVSSAFTDSSVTEANFKTAITNQREFLAGLLGTDGENSTALKTLGSLGSDTVAKSSAYTVVAADRGVVFICTGTFTLSLTAAATLADGFIFSVINVGTGIVTIDPSSTEQIDGANTKDIAAGSWAIVSCTGAAFYSMGAVPTTGALIGYQVFTASGTYTKATNNPSFVIVEVVGGGGNGGAGWSTTTAGVTTARYGGAGGGGGYAKKKVLSSVLSSSETITIGGAVSTSSFGAHCSATGGTSGSGSPAGANGVGGTGSGGDINISGMDGQVGANSSGGSSQLGFGGAGVAAAGKLYGGGGVGNFGGGAGGAGASGIVIVWEYK